MDLLDFDHARTELWLATAGNFITFAHHFWHDGRFSLGLSCESGCVGCVILTVGKMARSL